MSQNIPLRAPIYGEFLCVVPKVVVSLSDFLKKQLKRSPPVEGLKYLAQHGSGEKSNNEVAVILGLLWTSNLSKLSLNSSDGFFGWFNIIFI